MDAGAPSTKAGGKSVLSQGQSGQSPSWEAPHPEPGSHCWPGPFPSSGSLLAATFLLCDATCLLIRPVTFQDLGTQSHLAWVSQRSPAEALGDGVSQMHGWQGPGPRPELLSQPSAGPALLWSGLRASLSTAGTRSHLGQTQWTALWPFWEQPGCRSRRPRIRSPLPPPAGRGQ